MQSHLNEKSLADLVKKVSQIVSTMSGVQLGEKQEAMVSSRLSTRMSRLGIAKPNDYINYLQANSESESQALLSLMTTHHTYFFREFSHFEFLLNQALERMIAVARKRPDRKIRIWSAACSTGQEVYSLAMFFRFHLKAYAPDLSFEILGTDIDPKSVNYARNGVYKNEELKSSPAMYVEGNWIRGAGEAEGFSKVKKELKAYCRFEPLNLFEAQNLKAVEKWDLIFCRNVFIYFNESQIKQLSTTLLQRLDEQGHLVLGISETLMGMGLEATLVGPSTYLNGKVKRSESAGKRIEKTVTESLAPAKIDRVLCIDDSPTIHALLGKILVPAQGFTIAAKANNGLEAIEILKSEKFDAITLDLHMPEVDGITFLQRFKDRSTPILIISSVNRDEASLGKRALELGAFDYVEKPSLENIAQAGNEIRAKLKLGISSKKKVSVSAVFPSPGSEKKIRTLIVDDSATIRDLLSRILKRDPAFEIVGEAERPSQVAGLIERLKPDLMTLDIHMPEMDGVTLLKTLTKKFSIPTVMISSISREEGPYVLDALENGAVDYIQKPKLSELAELAPIICERLKIAARSRQRPKLQSRKVVTSQTGVQDAELVVIGSSTGGTEAVRIVLEALPSEIPPILIVQHIPAIFSKAFADRLNQLCPFSVKEAESGDIVQANRVLIAPGGKQMAVRFEGGKKVIEIKDDAPVNRHKPSVDYLFRSVAESRDTQCVAIMLTGMGADGARQMKALRDKGCRTIAQDEATSVVFGMPRAAIELGGAEFVLPLDQIAQKLIDLSLKGIRRKAG